MEWVVRYYLYQGKVWDDRYKNRSVSAGASVEAAAGAAAYAARQHVRWHNLAASADRRFKMTNPNHNSHVMSSFS